MALSRSVRRPLSPDRSGSGHGPLIDRELLRRFGLVSAAAWRAFLRLAYLWDAAKARNGGRRIYATRPKVRRDRDGVLIGRDDRLVMRKDGRPVGDWSDPRVMRLYRCRRSAVDRTQPAAGGADLGAVSCGHLGLGRPCAEKSTHEDCHHGVSEPRRCPDTPRMKASRRPAVSLLGLWSHADDVGCPCTGSAAAVAHHHSRELAMRLVHRPAAPSRGSRGSRGEGAGMGAGTGSPVGGQNEA